VVVGHDQDVSVAGQLPQEKLAGHRLVHRDVRDPVGDVGQPEWVELLGPRVDEMQLELQPGQDPGQLVAHVAHPEHGDHGPRGQRLQQHLHHPAAALPPVLVAGVLAQAGLLGLRAGRTGGDQLPGPLDRRRLEVAAADTAPGVVRADDHLRPRRPRCVPADLDDRHEHTGQPVVPELLSGAEPVHGQTPASAGASRLGAGAPAALAAWIAQ
jgi:hypothetical protein